MRNSCRSAGGVLVVAAFTLYGAPAAMAEDVHLRVEALSGQVASGLSAVAAKWKTMHPDVTIDVESQTDEHNFQATAPATLFRSADGPDSSWWWCTTTFQWKDMIAAGLLDSVDDAWDDKAYSKSIIDYYTHQDGHKYAVSDGIVWQPYIFYNKSIFTKLGLGSPKTWEELYALSDKLRAAGYQPISSNFDWNFVFSLPAALMERAWSREQYDAMLVNWSPSAPQATLKYKWTDPDSIAIFRKLKEVADRKLLADGFAGSSDIEVAKSLFLSGKAAMFQNGSWEGNGSLAQDKFDVGYFYFPPLDKPASGKVVAGPINCLLAFKGRDHLDAVKDFLKFAVSHEGSFIYAKASGIVATRTDFTKAELDQLLNPMSQQMVSDAATDGLPPAIDTSIDPDLLTVLKRVSGEVLTNVTSPEDAGKKLQAAWDKAHSGK